MLNKIINKIELYIIILNNLLKKQFIRLIKYIKNNIIK